MKTRLVDAERMNYLIELFEEIMNRYSNLDSKNRELMKKMDELVSKEKKVTTDYGEYLVTFREMLLLAHDRTRIVAEGLKKLTPESVDILEDELNQCEKNARKYLIDFENIISQNRKVTKEINEQI